MLRYTVRIDTWKLWQRLKQAGELPADKHVADWLYAHGFVAHGERWACDARGLKALRPDEISFKRQIS